MAATRTTLSDILKDFYLGPIQDQLNEEVLALDLMEKATVDWSGKQVIIPVHVARNSGVGYRAESVALPGAGEQDFERLVVEASFLYGRFQISGPAIASAKTGGKNSFIGYVDAEMTKLVSDVRNQANKCVFSGGATVGFLNEKKNTAGAPPAGSEWDFSGDIDKLETTRAAVAAAGGVLNLRVIRADTYATVNTIRVQAPAAAGVGSIAAGQIMLDALDTSNVPNGTACVVVMQDDAGATAPITALADEPTGIFGNLGFNTLFGVDRTDATGAAALQSVLHSPDDAGNDNRDDVSLGALQRLLDGISIASDEVPNLFLVHPSFRQEYAQILMGTSAGNLTKEVSNVGKADGGFSSLSYNNIAMRVSRHAPKGAVVALSTASWKLCELESGGFADLDGAILSRVANTDAFEGFYRWYYETVCTRPGANGVLCGLNYPGSL